MSAGQLFDTVRVGVASTPGTGAITVGSVSLGQTFASAGVPDGFVGSYRLDDTGGGWEIGVGTYNATAGTWTRTTVLKSSNANAAINASAAAILSLVPLRRDLRTLVKQLDITATIATLDLSGVFTSEFDDYEIVFEGIVPATANVFLKLLVESGGSFQATGYLNQGLWAGGGTSGIIGNDATGQPLMVGNTYGVNNAVPGFGGDLKIFNVNRTDSPKIMRGKNTYPYSTAYSFMSDVGGFWNSNGAVTGFRVVPSSGNFSFVATGLSRVKVFGVP